ncbi:MAG: magnesium-dependent phosphatase-1 [Cyclobacteriaceae bacterium]
MMFVFDLDFTLWDCGGTWCDCTNPPFAIKGSEVYDKRGRHIRLYPEVIPILDKLKSKGNTMALASRTEEPEWAIELIKLLDISHYFKFKEIFPDRKTIHFEKLKFQSAVPYQKMVFFDDEFRNIKDVSALGVHCILVPNGLNTKLVEPWMP